MSEFHTIKIKAPVGVYGTTVEIDGKPIDGITKIAFSIIADDMVRLDMSIIGSVEFEGEFKDTDLVLCKKELPWFKNGAEKALG